MTNVTKFFSLLRSNEPGKHTTVGRRSQPFLLHDKLGTYPYVIPGCERAALLLLQHGAGVHGWRAMRIVEEQKGEGSYQRLSLVCSDFGLDGLRYKKALIR